MATPQNEDKLIQLARAFLAFAEHGSYGDAATALNCTRQVAYNRIAAFEAYLGQGRLVEASADGSGSQLTPLGEHMIAPARHITGAGHHARQAARNFNAPQSRAPLSHQDIPAARDFTRSCH